MRGGRAFTAPLPFALGTNEGNIYGLLNEALTALSGTGMKWCRSGYPWNSAVYTFSGIEGLPGVYSASSISTISGFVSTVKSYGMSPLVCITVNQNPAFCPMLGTPLVSGTGYTSITISGVYSQFGIPFAITSGNSLVLTNPNNQSQTQTITTVTGMAIGGSGTITTSSFTANHNYASGAWIYDTTWPACTPQHFANMMNYLVAQSGLQGLNWELINEPDGSSTSSSPTLLYQMYALTYSGMKSVDPTCTVHGLVLEGVYLNPGGGNSGSNYYNQFVQAASGYAANPTGSSYTPSGYLYDITDVHNYSNDDSYVTDASPYFVGPSQYNMFDGFALFRRNMLAQGDTTYLWLTEFGWPNGNAGIMTPHIQAQFYQDYLTGLIGNDKINGGNFSDYLKVVIQYAADNAGANWGIIGSPDDTSIVIPIITELITGH